MSAGVHRHRVIVEWTGRTTGYRDYTRDHLVTAAGPQPIAGSSDPAFLGNPNRWNPEQLFVASIAACHQLWFLHLAAEAGLVVSRYRDRAEGVLDATAGRISEVTLRPWIEVERGDRGGIAALHAAAHSRCFIARSLAIPIRICPETAPDSERAGPQQLTGPSPMDAQRSTLLARFAVQHCCCNALCDESYRSCLSGILS